jgi:hypothetical protein
MAGTGWVQAISSTGRFGRMAAALTIGLALAFAGTAKAEKFTIDAIANEAAPAAKSIVIAGDSLGDGLYIGFYRLLRKDTAFTVEKRSKVSTGLSRPDFYDWVAQAKTVVEETKPDYIIFVVGGNDVQALKNGKKWVKYGTDEWNEIYKSRITSVMDTFENAGAKTFWVGMPVIRLPKLNRGVQYLNTIYKDYASKRNGITFISAFDLTADKDGKFQSHYKDAAGRKRQMRTNDGIHFTTAGYINLSEHILAKVRAHAADRLASREVD